MAKKVRVMDIEATEVPGHEGYFISKCGRIFREPYERVGKVNHGEVRFTTKWREIKCRNNEYKQLEVHKEGRRSTAKLHRLLALTYIPNPDNLPQVNHIDGDKFNNNLENLEWCSCRDNVTHSYRTGLACNKGERHPRSLFTQKQVDNLRERRLAGEPVKSLAESFGVGVSTIYKITSGVNWRNG